MKKLLLSASFFALALASAKAQFPAPYCNVSFTSTDGIEPITRVTVIGAGLNNTSSPTVSTSTVPGPPAVENWLAMTANVTQGVNYPMEVQGNTNGAYTCLIRVFVDWNQDNDFVDAGESYTMTNIVGSTGTDAIVSTGTLAVPLTALTGTTRMRVIKRFNTAPTSCYSGSGFGQAEDYTVNVAATTVCTGTPSAGTYNGPTAVCPGVNFNLNTDATNTGSGITYQWQSSTDGVTYGNVASGTTQNFVTSQTVATYYQLVVTCGTTGLTSTSAPVLVNLNTFASCYCTPPHTAATACNSNVTYNTINNTSGTSCTLPSYTAYPTSSFTTTVQKSVPYNLSVTNTLSAIVSVWIDYNQNGTFEASEWTQVATASTAGAPSTISLTIPGTALTGTTGMRIRSREAGNPNGAADACASFGSGETEDYIITIDPAPACVNAPVGGTLAGPASDSLGNTMTYTLSGHNGDMIQWYTSTDGGATWNLIVGESGTTVDIEATEDVQVIAVLSSPGCTNDSSNVVSTTVITYDNVCNAFPLVMGTNGPYSTDNATVEAGEVAPPIGDCVNMSSWCNDDLNATAWFTFEAPASGHVTINTPDFDTQIAVWEVGDCSDFSTFTLVTANDDDTLYTMHGGVEYSSYINGAYCLTPGATYYLQLDAYSGTGTTDIILGDPGPSAPVVVNLMDSSYCGNMVTIDAGMFASYDWSTGETTQTIDYTGTGTVSVTVTDEFGCEGSGSAIYTSIEPMANFSIVQTLNEVDLTSTSTPAGGAEGTTYDWDYGDSNTGSGETVSHTYAANGMYTITLVVTNGCGDDTLTQNVTVTGVSVFDITGNTVLNVYPNPANEIVNIMGQEAIVSMQLVNAAGQVVVNNTNVNATSAKIDVSAFERGIYVLNVTTASGSYTVNVSVVK